MGKWVILIGEPPFGPEAVRGMAFQGRTGVRDWGEKQLDVLFPDGGVCFQFDYDGDIRRDYDPALWAALHYRDPQCVLLRYSSREALKAVIGAPDFPKDVLIDGDGEGGGGPDRGGPPAPLGGAAARKLPQPLANSGKACYTIKMIRLRAKWKLPDFRREALSCLN